MARLVSSDKLRLDEFQQICDLKKVASRLRGYFDLRQSFILSDTWPIREDQNTIESNVLRLPLKFPSGPGPNVYRIYDLLLGDEIVGYYLFLKPVDDFGNFWEFSVDSLGNPFSEADETVRIKNSLFKLGDLDLDSSSSISDFPISGYSTHHIDAIEGSYTLFGIFEDVPKDQKEYLRWLKTLLGVDGKDTALFFIREQNATAVDFLFRGIVLFRSDLLDDWGDLGERKDINWENVSVLAYDSRLEDLATINGITALKRHILNSNLETKLEAQSWICSMADWDRNYEYPGHAMNLFHLHFGSVPGKSELRSLSERRGLEA